MARQQQEQLTPKQRVLRDLEAARASLANHATQAAEEWTPRALMSRSFEKHRSLWIGGMALAGLALTQLLRSGGRRENFTATAKNSGLVALLLGPFLALGRKTLIEHGTRWFESFLHQKISPNAPNAEKI